MRYVIYTSNPNGVLNQPEGTIFTHLAPALYFNQILKNQDFEIKYKQSNEVLTIGSAKVEEFNIYPPAVLSEMLALVSFGYPAKSVLTIFNKKYPEFNIYKNNLIAVIFRWTEKRISGISKIHVPKIAKIK
ncbi:MAG: hypothetical protein JXR68_14295 [Bacteroidales bacterium]|nr:hypothetical protein [Bacteroidales bacterium]